MEETGEEVTVRVNDCPQGSRYSSNGITGTVQIQVTDSPEVPPDRVVRATELQILGVELRQGSDVGQYRPL